MKPNKDYCPYNNGRVHSFKDYSYWNKENHPCCENCGYVDKSRVIKKRVIKK